MAGRRQSDRPSPQRSTIRGGGGAVAYGRRSHLQQGAAATAAAVPSLRALRAAPPHNRWPRQTTVRSAHLAAHEQAKAGQKPQRTARAQWQVVHMRVWAVKVCRDIRVPPSMYAASSAPPPPHRAAALPDRHGKRLVGPQPRRNCSSNCGLRRAGAPPLRTASIHAPRPPCPERRSYRWTHWSQRETR